MTAASLNATHGPHARAHLIARQWPASDHIDSRFAFVCAIVWATVPNFLDLILPDEVALRSLLAGVPMHGRTASTVARISRALERISLLDPMISAFIEVRADDALAIARRADERFIRGEAPRPLEGMPVAFKDMFSHRSRRATFGSARGQQHLPLRNAEVVERLEAAGAIAMGFLNMSEFALGPTGHNRTFGHCRNPWNLDRITGGSSSGACAALAANFIVGAIGSDTGGSIRIPAACCGVVGLKPTTGQISTEGAMPLSWTLDCVGPLARTAIDCTQIFEAMTESRAGIAADETSRARLVFPRNVIAGHACDEVARHVDQAMTVFAELGFSIDYNARLPDITELQELASTIQAFEASVVHAENLRDRRYVFTPHVLKRILPGLDIPKERYIEALDQRPRRLWDFLETSLLDGTVLVLPVLGCLVPTIAETDQERLGALPDLVAQMTYWTRWLNYLGVPALSLPCGIDRNGMPVGMQLVGAPRTERMLLAIAAAYQACVGVFTAPQFRT